MPAFCAPNGLSCYFSCAVPLLCFGCVVGLSSASTRCSFCFARPRIFSCGCLAAIAGSHTILQSSVSIRDPRGPFMPSNCEVPWCRPCRSPTFAWRWWPVMLMAYREYILPHTPYTHHPLHSNLLTLVSPRVRLPCPPPRALAEAAGPRLAPSPTRASLLWQIFLFALRLTPKCVPP